MTPEDRRSPVDDNQGRLNRIRRFFATDGSLLKGQAAFLLDHIDALTADRADLIAALQRVKADRAKAMNLLDHLRYQGWFQEANDGEECRMVTALLDNSPSSAEPASEVDDKRDPADVVNFCDALLGQEAYTWEIPGSDFGEYRFETADDPRTIYGEEAPLIRKRWRLIEVVKYEGGQSDE